MSEPENVKAVMMGPCCICGDTGYPPSMGGPFICPQCDCGTFTQATVMRQAKDIARLREENDRLLARLEHLQNEAADVVRENKDLRYEVSRSSYHCD